MREECHTSGEDYLSPEEACQYFGDNVTWAAFGDSHVVEPAYALSRELERDGVGLVHLSFSSCPPALLFEVNIPGCTDWFRDSLAYLEDNQSIQNVFLGFRYSAFLYGRQMGDYPELPDQLKRSALPNGYRDYSDQEIRELYWQSLSMVIQRLRNADKNVYLLYPIPELPVHIEKVVLPNSVLSTRTMFDVERTTTADYYVERNKFILDKLDSLIYDNGLYAVRPFDAFCDGEYCPAVLDGQALYYDDHHLRIFGSTLLVRNMLSQDQ